MTLDVMIDQGINSSVSSGCLMRHPDQPIWCKIEETSSSGELSVGIVG